MSPSAKRKRTRQEIQRGRQALQARLERQRQLSRIRMQRMRERARATEDVEPVETLSWFGSRGDGQPITTAVEIDVDYSQCAS